MLAIRNQETTSSIAVFKVALNKLLAALKSSTLELQKAVTAKTSQVAQSEKEKDKKRAVDSQSTPVNKRGKGPDFMDLVADASTALPTFSFDAEEGNKPEWLRKKEGGDAAPNLYNAQPYVISSIPWVKNFEGSVRESLNQFAKDFADSNMRKDFGRGMRPNTDASGSEVDAVDFLVNKMAGLNAPGALLAPAITGKTDGEKCLKSNLQLCNFGIRANSTHVSYEKAGLWSGRLTVAGVREVVLVSLSKVQQHLRASGIVGIDPKMFLRDLRAEGIKKAAEAGVVFWVGTLAPGDLLFTPCNFLARERIKDKDSCGLRYSMVLPRDRLGMEYFKELDAAPSTPAGHVAKGVKVYDNIHVNDID